MKKDSRALIIIAALVVLYTVPFLNMGYHVDADWFMDLADQIIKDPLRAYSGYSDIGYFSGTPVEFDGNSTPLASYYLAAVFTLFGRDEIPVHASYVLFSLMAGFSFYYLAKRFTPRPLLTSILFISSLVFIFMSHNIMLDIPMLGLMLLGVTLFIYGVDKDKHGLMTLGGIFIGLAYLAKPNGIVSLPLLLLYPFLKRKYQYMLYILAPAIIISLWCLETYIFEGRVFFIDHLPFLFTLKKSYDIQVMTAYFFSNLAYIGGATIFPLFFIYPFIRKKRNIYVLLASLVFMIFVAFGLYKVSVNFISGQYNLLELMLFVSFTTSFIFFLLIVLLDYGKYIFRSIIGLFCSKKKKINYDLLFILLWFYGIYAFNTLVSGGSAKYVTLILTPLILTFVIILKKYCLKYNLSYSKILIAVIVFTIPMSLAVSYADYQYADVYRDFAYKQADSYKTEENTVWYNGFYGFRYYMREMGYPILKPQSNEPEKGDFVIVARIPSPRPLSEELKKRIQLVDTIEITKGIPIRTQNQDSHAGFYTYGGGFIPYSFSNEPHEIFFVYYVKE